MTSVKVLFWFLDEIDDAIKAKKDSNTLKELSSQFYTIIPHDFGRTIPPPIATAADLREKLDMLLVLGEYSFTIYKLLIQFLLTQHRISRF